MRWIAVIGWIAWTVTLFSCDESGQDGDSPCFGIDCSSHGVCVEDGDAFICECHGGYTGELCELCEIGLVMVEGQCVPAGESPCIPNPCEHGTCSVQDDGISIACECMQGFAGDLCDRCADDYLDDGSGDCIAVDGDNPADGDVPDGDSSDGDMSDGDFLDGDTDGDTEGDFDVEDVDVCIPNPCTDLHKTVCVPNDDTFSCSCEPGYSETAGLCVPDCDVEAGLCSAAHDSAPKLVSANGYSAVAWDKTSRKIDTFLEHMYRNWDEDVWTRDLLFDSYFGLRYDGTGKWLDTVEPLHVGYLRESGVIHLVRDLSGLRVETFVYAPFEIDAAAMVMLIKVTNTRSQAADVSLYSLHNAHLGYTSAEDPVNPDAEDESIIRDASGAWVEKGVGGTLVYRSFELPSHAGCSPQNPYQALLDGHDLADNTGDVAVGDDRVAGFQKDVHLEPGSIGWFGVAMAYHPGDDAVSLLAKLETVYGDKTSETVLAEAVDAWETWRVAPPAGLSPAELAVYRQSEAVLRMGQVRENSDLSYGQILASMPPGNWNICWMRDMAYAIVALARSGHAVEARAALEFVLNADSGYYESYSGVPYQVTITRYFGRGKEETDSNENGPNIEYDGFGLFLWALAETMAAEGDTSLLDDNWVVVRDKIAGALVDLVDDSNMIGPDSSIWEVHWNGQQKHYSYTTLTAANGLCAISPAVRSLGHGVEADFYETAAAGLRNALKAGCVDNANVLASSIEELTNGWGHYDVATVEAFNWPILDPSGGVADATFAMYDSHLQVASGHGYFRNDDGGWYDSQEWVFVDLRAARALRRAGETAKADALLDWITAQALANQGLISELHHPTSGDYEGEYPMVGFGAGAYLLAIFERLDPSAVSAACGDW